MLSSKIEKSLLNNRIAKLNKEKSEVLDELERERLQAKKLYKAKEIQLASKEAARYANKSFGTSLDEGYEGSPKQLRRGSIQQQRRESLSQFEINENIKLNAKIKEFSDGLFQTVDDEKETDISRDPDSKISRNRIVKGNAYKDNKSIIHSVQSEDKNIWPKADILLEAKNIIHSVQSEDKNIWPDADIMLEAKERKSFQRRTKPSELEMKDTFLKLEDLIPNSSELGEGNSLGKDDPITPKQENRARRPTRVSVVLTTPTGLTFPRTFSPVGFLDDHGQTSFNKMLSNSETNLTDPSILSDANSQDVRQDESRYKNGKDRMISLSFKSESHKSTDLVRNNDVEPAIRPPITRISSSDLKARRPSAGRRKPSMTEEDKNRERTLSPRSMSTMRSGIILEDEKQKESSRRPSSPHRKIAIQSSKDSPDLTEQMRSFPYSFHRITDCCDKTVLCTNNSTSNRKTSSVARKDSLLQVPKSTELFLTAGQDFEHGSSETSNEYQNDDNGELFARKKLSSQSSKEGRSGTGKTFISDKNNTGLLPPIDFKRTERSRSLDLWREEFASSE